MQFEQIEIDGKMKSPIVHIDTEDRMLSFPTNGAVTRIKIKNELTKSGQLKKTAYEVFKSWCIKISSTPHIKVVLVDSVTKLMDLIYVDEWTIFQELPEKQKSNTQRFYGQLGNVYKELFGSTIPLLSNKIVFATAHDIVPKKEEKDKKYRVPVSGNAVKGGIEASFDNVFWTKFNKDGNVADGTRFQLQTCSNMENMAHSHLGLFDEEKEMFIPSNLANLLDMYTKYYGISDPMNETDKYPSTLIVGPSGWGKTTCAGYLIKGGYFDGKINY